MDVSNADHSHFVTASSPRICGRLLVITKNDNFPECKICCKSEIKNMGWLLWPNFSVDPEGLPFFKYIIRFNSNSYCH